ncbi:MAG: ABC transporter ATP-binding protein [Bellilinea sp.]|nr:MAG: ABC transporter ATP-binding protein [Bellilinea sp.]
MSFNDTLVVETNGLEKSFGNVKVLQGVDLSVKQNSIFGFLGPNGAGKTTTMKILLGLIRPTGGSGSIFGRDIVQESVAIRKRIGYLPQQPRFIEYMSARENLEITAAFFYTGPKSKIRMRCDEMLELVGLTDKAERPIRTFSGGEKQRLGIALAQVNYPDLLILDEPASALDPLGRQEVLEIMQRLRKHTSIFYSTHILDDVQRVSDSVAILNHGKVVASGPIELILNGQGSIIYCMTIKGEPEGLGEKLANLPWVTHTSVSQHNSSSLWQISVNNEVAAEKDLLRYVLADEMITVTEFNRKKYELEEVFMEVIKGDGNGR